MVDKKSLAKKVENMMANMHDIKLEKPKKAKGIEMVEYSRAVKPSIYMSSDEYSDIGKMTEGMKIGDEVLMLARCRITGMNERERVDEKGNKKKHKSVDMEVQSVSMV